MHYRVFHSDGTYLDCTEVMPLWGRSTVAIIDMEYLGDGGDAYQAIKESLAE